MSVKKRVNALEVEGVSRGCFVKDGKLRSAFRGERVECNCSSPVKFARYATGLNKIFVVAEGRLYEAGDDFSFTYDADCGESPFLIETRTNGAPTAAIICGNRSVLLYGTVITPVLKYSLSCGVTHCGRLFAADGDDGYVLRWSGTENFNDVTEGIDGSGFVKLDAERGKILALLEFSGKIVAVREYGLTLLDMHGSPEKFSVEVTDTDCDKVFKNTACVVGDKLCFYSATGLKCFDGGKIRAFDLPRVAATPKDCAAYDGKYFLACGAFVFCADIEREVSCVIEENADCIFVKDGVYFGNATGLKKLAEGGGFAFESGEFDFGTGRKKTVTGIDVQGKADISLSNGRTTRLFGGASGIVRPHMRGTRFTVKAEGEGGLDGICVIAEVTDVV